MIRVLHIVSGMGIGGIEEMLMNYYRHIDRTQIQFDFLLHPGAPIDTSQTHWNEIQSLGGKIYVYDGPLGIRNIFQYIKFLDSFFSTHKFDIIHAHYNPDFCKITLWRAKKAGIRHRIMHSHSNFFNYSFLHKIFYTLASPWLKTSATFYCACSGDAGKIAFGSKIVNSNQYKTIYNAIDINNFQYNPTYRNKIRQQYGLSENTIVLGHVGRFDKPKNQSFLIDVLTILKKLNSNFFLILIGDGESKDAVISKARTLKIADFVIFAGNQAHAEYFYMAFDIFILPSIYESLGIVNIEAQASGLPCLISDTCPPETQILETTQFLPITAGATVWAQKIIDISNTLTTNKRNSSIYSDELQSWDIHNNAKLLETFYFEQIMRENI